MSLDQLPNELITHVGSFLSFEDNIQFGLSQKRINAVLKRDGLLKPECERLQFTNVTHPRGYFTLDGSTQLPFEEEKRDPRFNSAVGQIINKFRKIEVLDLHYVVKVTEDVFKDLINTKTKLSSLHIPYGEIDAVDPNIFIAACKKFNNILLYSTLLPTELLCDQVFVELMQNTSFALMNFGYGPIDGYSLTDRTLKALSDVGVKYCFGIQRILTSFTMAGIKTLVEEVLKAKATDVRYLYNLGILKFSEQRNAVRWMEEVAADTECPYTMNRVDPVLPEMEINYYTIRQKDNTHRRIHIDFAINQVEI